jgi:hypothetical protein
MREIDKFESDCSHSEDQLASALRDLAQASPRSAPPEVGAALGAAFHRHHRRRRVKNFAIAALVVIGLSSAAWLSTRAPRKATPQIAIHPPTPAARIEKATTASVPGTQEIKRIVKPTPRHSAPRREQSPTEVAARQDGDFLPLPDYDPAAPQGELRIIRVEMPIQDLRLVGAPVSAGIPNRRVLADFVVGQDGTPYGVRLVQ